MNNIYLHSDRNEVTELVEMCEFCLCLNFGKKLNVGVRKTCIWVLVLGDSRRCPWHLWSLALSGWLLGCQHRTHLWWGLSQQMTQAGAVTMKSSPSVLSVCKRKPPAVCTQRNRLKISQREGGVLILSDAKHEASRCSRTTHVCTNLLFSWGPGSGSLNGGASAEMTTEDSTCSTTVNHCLRREGIIRRLALHPTHRAWTLSLCCTR